jgi:hypothetical protein
MITVTKLLMVLEVLRGGGGHAGMNMDDIFTAVAPLVVVADLRRRRRSRQKEKTQ